jgi:hypothetical protein
MTVSRIKFVFAFLIFAFAFLLISTQALEQAPETFIGSYSPQYWKSVISTILSPIKIIVVGPLLPFIRFMHQDPETPPPYFLIGFALHWAILALILHYLLSKVKNLKSST